MSVVSIDPNLNDQANSVVTVQYTNGDVSQVPCLSAWNMLYNPTTAATISNTQDLILQCNRISQLECCKGANGAYATSGSTLCGSFWGGSTANSGTCDNIITQFCNQNINDPTCSCLNSPMWRNPPTGFQANPVCFDQNCTTNAKNNPGYITAGMSAIGCELSVQICEQYINVGPDSNYNVLNQVQQQQQCSQIIQNASSTTSTSSSSQSSGGGGTTSSNSILFVIIGIVVVLLIAGGGVYYWYNYVRSKNIHTPHFQPRQPIQSRPRAYPPRIQKPGLYQPQRHLQLRPPQQHLQQHIQQSQRPLQPMPPQRPRGFYIRKPDYLQTRPQTSLAIPNRFTQ